MYPSRMCESPVVKASTIHHGRALSTASPVSVSRWVTHFTHAKLLCFSTPQPFWSLLPFSFSRFLPHWHLFQAMMNWALEQLHSLYFPNQLAVCVLKNTSIKSQQSVKGNRDSHLKANDVLPCEQELCILICRLLSHLYNFEPLFNEARLVPMMGNYIITMLMLKALYFTPSTCGFTARRKALTCQLGFRFWSCERLIQEMLLCLPCSRVQQGLGSWWAVGVPVVWGSSVLQPAAGD